MDSKRLEQLIERYWNCETSVEEENELKAYFSSADVPEKYKDTAAVFQYFSKSKDVNLKDESFTLRLSDTVKDSGSDKVRQLVLNTMKIAAGIAVLLIAFWFVHNEVKTPADEKLADTYTDPKVAFEETKKALMIISKGFGTAEAQTKELKIFNEAQEQIQRSNDTKQ